MEHSLRCIEFIVDELPNIKLIFWCACKRTYFEEETTQGMYKGLYPKLVERFRANSLDILQYCTGKEFDTDLTCDRSGHPSKKGYDMLQKMLADSLRSDR